MIADASTADRSAFDRTFDVCVIGAGPAGITLARSLAAAGATVALMEAGSLEISEASQDAYRGSNLGQEYFDLDVSRLRFFGGTSNHWGGWTRALEAVDFFPRPWVPRSGWPITQLDLDPRARKPTRSSTSPRRPRPPTCRCARPATTSTASSSFSPPPASPRSTWPRSRLRRGSPLSSTPTSSTSASTTR